MLYPQRNKFRQYIDLSGFWDVRFDHDNKGIEANWIGGFAEGQPIAVPASWNDQFADNRDFLGPAWYQTYFNLPTDWKEQQVNIRFGSVNYIADVWLNGEKIGQHEGGHLPFEFNITSLVKNGNNHLVVRVDGTLAKDRVPPSGRALNFPPTNYDFFPYCGIHRPVLIYVIPQVYIKDITVRTYIEENLGKVSINLECSNEKATMIEVELKGHGIDMAVKVPVNNKRAETILEVTNPALWEPNAPNLYELKINLLENDTKLDSYSLKFGIRTIEVRGDELLLNGKPIKLIGLAKHIDFPITGRGYVPAVMIKDYSLLKWIGANSFRTSHYPYSEQMMDLADQLGFLIIDETPAVGLTFMNDVIERHLDLCKQYVQELITRDKNHPSVIMWSLANEPHGSAKSKEFFRKLYELAKNLDPTRPVTLVNMQGVKNRSFEFLDIICLNRYYGWYTNSGRIEDGSKDLSKELDDYHKKYSKPIILSEFGADTIPGWHAQPPEMFSEEYQVESLKKYIEVLNAKPYVVGQHIWNMCDFKTSQAIIRMGGMNYKGVFTRDRRPKMAAHFLRKIWSENNDQTK